MNLPGFAGFPEYILEQVSLNRPIVHDVIQIYKYSSPYRIFYM
jgi:hypothetical protein